MKLIVHSVLDKAVGAFLQPFYSRSRGEAIRSFSDACSKPESPFWQHSDDYVLYYFGEFDDGSGMFECGEPSRVLSARECLNTDAGASAGAPIVMPPRQQ